MSATLRSEGEVVSDEELALLSEILAIWAPSDLENLRCGKFFLLRNGGEGEDELLVSTRQWDEAFAHRKPFETADHELHQIIPIIGTSLSNPWAVKWIMNVAEAYFRMYHSGAVNSYGYYILRKCISCEIQRRSQYGRFAAIAPVVSSPIIYYRDKNTILGGLADIVDSAASLERLPHREDVLISQDPTFLLLFRVETEIRMIPGLAPEALGIWHDLRQEVLDDPVFVT